jgi:hypothetical protein
MRNTVAAMFGAAVALGSGPAFAQATFGPKGTAAFSADRLFGFYSVHDETETPAGDIDVDSTTFGFAWQGGFAPSPYTIPRLGFDYFVINSLSIGGSIAYANIDYDDADAEASAFIFAPRVGYVWMFGDVVGFWLRGGLTYHSYDRENSFDENGFAFTGDPMFVIAPTAHFGFVIGPILEFTISGERETGAGDVDHRYTTIGIAMGPMGWF